jgi:DeoR/GlpR family transcriptional regulator of sugar metabolism
MIPTKRRQLILEYIQERDIVEIDEISKKFCISIPTVHRDLIQLEEEGFLRKVRGGATSQPSKIYETSYQNRSRLYPDEKKSIAKYALRFVEDDMSLMLDNSTTVLALARMLGGFHGLTVITYFEEIIHELSRPGYQISLVSTGGELNRTHLTLVGPLVEASLKDMHVRIAFISTSAVNPTLGIMHPYSDECQRKQLIIQAAEEVILLVDHSKFEKTALNIVAPLAKIKRIVTDRALDPESTRQILDQGIELHIAGNE